MARLRDRLQDGSPKGGSAAGHRQGLTARIQARGSVTRPCSGSPGSGKNPSPWPHVIARRCRSPPSSSRTTRPCPPSSTPKFQGTSCPKNAVQLLRQLLRLLPARGAYIPQRDIYIEKDLRDINEDIGPPAPRRHERGCCRAAGRGRGRVGPPASTGPRLARGTTRKHDRSPPQGGTRLDRQLAGAGKLGRQSSTSGRTAIRPAGKFRVAPATRSRSGPALHGNRRSGVDVRRRPLSRKDQRKGTPHHGYYTS